MTIRQIYVTALTREAVQQGLTAADLARVRARFDGRLDVAVRGDEAVEKMCQAGVPCVVAGGVVLFFARIGRPQPTFLDLATAIFKIAYMAKAAGEESASFAERMNAAAYALLDAAHDASLQREELR